MAAGRWTFTSYTRNPKDQITKMQASKGTNVEATRYTYSPTGTGAPARGPACSTKVDPVAMRVGGA